MSFLEKNLELLDKHRPDLVKRVKEFEQEKKEENLIVESSRQDVPTAKWSIDGTAQYLHSSYDPVKEAEKWIDRIKDDYKKAKRAIIVGFGLGYHIEAYLNTIPDSIKTIVFEPKMEIFYQALCNRDLTKLFDNVNIHYSIEESEKYITGRIAALTADDLTESPVLKLFPTYDRIFPEYCSYVEKELRENLGNKILNINTILFFSNLWPTNFFKNLMDVLHNPGLGTLFDKFKDKPAIVVSAGPSLTKNVELLKEIKDKAFIICVDTALRVLLDRGITPDVVVIVDGSDLNYKHYEGVEPGSIPVVFNSIANEKMVKMHKERKLPVNMRVSLMDWLEKTIELDVGSIDQTGPSVANIALQVADKVGANPIVLIGQDLAYTNGNSHASGTALCTEDVVKKKNPINLLKVKDIYGEEVYTDRGFYSMLKTFESFIAQMDAKVIDATEGGAKIEGTEIMTLREVIDRYCLENINISGTIDQVFDNYTGLSEEKREKLIAAFKDVKKSLKKMRALGNRGSKLADELFKYAKKDRLDDIKTSKVLKKMDNIDTEIKEQEDMMTFIQLIIQPVMLQVTRGPLAEAPEDESEQDKGKRIARKSQVLYKGIAEVCDYMLGLVEDFVEELEGN